jgi:hypothetical protein
MVVDCKLRSISAEKFYHISESPEHILETADFYGQELGYRMISFNLELTDLDVVDVQGCRLLERIYSHFAETTSLSPWTRINQGLLVVKRPICEPGSRVFILVVSFHVLSVY